MKDIYDLTSILDMNSFPWEEVCIGMAKSAKKASVFYKHSDRIGNLTPQETVWYKSIKYGNKISGLDILLTSSTNWGEAWFKLGYSDSWIDTPSIKNFPLLQKWIKDTNAFDQTGRQIFFMQMAGSNTPLHADQDMQAAPPNYRKHSEFIWITPPVNGKELLVNGVKTSNASWFNSYTLHETLPSDGTKWSFRVDGIFTSEFKEKLKSL